jgi:DNA-binding NarL/FixJ family response regulator
MPQLEDRSPTTPTHDPAVKDGGIQWPAEPDAASSIGSGPGPVGDLLGRLSLAEENSSGHRVGSSLDDFRRRLQADRMAIVQLHDDEFEVIREIGAPLLTAGTRLPIPISTSYVVASTPTFFGAAEFDEDPRWVRPLDAVVSAAGFRSGFTIPLLEGQRVKGALSMSSFTTGLGRANPTQRCSELMAGLLSMLAEESAPSLEILVCHDDAIVGQGLSRLLEQTSRRSVVLAHGIEDAEGYAAEGDFDVIVADMFLSGRRVDRLIPALRRAGTAAPVIVFASRDTPGNRVIAVNCGAAGYVSRAEFTSELETAIDHVAHGRTYLPERGPAAETEPLTPREQEVLAALDEGLRIKQIALRLGISQGTAKSHAQHIFRKLNVQSRAEAVRAARLQGLLE